MNNPRRLIGSGEKKFILFAFLSFVFPFLCVPGASASIFVPEIVHGEFTDTGTNFGGPNFAISGFPDNRRAFFTFDLSSLTSSISSATLRLHINSYQSLVDNFDFTVYDFVGNDADLALSQSGAPGIALWQDLGGGDIYATGSINPTTNPNSVTLVLSIDAILDINADAGGLFSIGIASNLTNDAELVRWQGPSQPGQAFLTLNEGPAPSVSAPEPTTLALLGLGLLGLGFNRRKKR